MRFNLKTKIMKNYLALIVVLLLSVGAKAQDRGSVLLNVAGGYTFGDRVDLYSPDYVQFGDGFQWGGGFEYFIQQNSSIGINYYRMDTKMEAYGRALGAGPIVQLNAGNDSGALNYILADYTYYFNTGSTTLKPYLAAGLGVGILETPQSGSNTNFAWDFKLGAKIKTGSPVSINLQAYLQSMSEPIGSSTYWNNWYGPISYTDYAVLYQFGLGAVISYDFKSNKM